MSAGRETLSYRGKRLIRAIGAILITASCLMVVLGVTVWSAQLQGFRYLLYWSWCFLLLMLTVLVALIDLLMIRRADRRTRRELFRQQFERGDSRQK